MEHQAQASDVNPYRAPETAVELRRREPRLGDLASRWARLGGAMIDGLIGGLIAVPVQYAMGVWDNFPDIKEPTFGGQLLWLLFGLVMFLVLHGYLMATRGQTIGKALVGTRMVRTNGSDAGLGRLFWLRYVPQSAVVMIPFVGVLLVGVDILFIFRADKRCIHDLIADTRVVKAGTPRRARTTPSDG